MTNVDFPCERTDSVTQNACALPLLGENCILSSHPPEHQHILFCAFLLEKMNGSDWESSQIGKTAAAEDKKIWIPFG